MLHSRLPSTLLVAFGVASLGVACGDGGTETTQIMVPGAAGSGNSASGSGNGSSGSGVGGGGAGPGAAGSQPVGGDTSGQAGSGPQGGTGGTPGAGGGSAGSGGGAAGGSAGGPMGGSGGTGGGAMGGSGGMGGTGGLPAGAIVLYDGTSATFGGWVKRNGGGANPWKNNPDKTMTVQTGTGDIISKETFQNVFLHVEYKTPMLPSDVGGQERGNSGVYLKSSYEMQVLDTYGKPPADDGCGALYGIRAPSVVACKQHEEWNVYEIEFKAQVCNDAGVKTANAKFVKVTLNGITVQDNVDAPSSTEAGLPENCAPRGILLQDHSSVQPVSFRNIYAIKRD